MALTACNIRTSPQGRELKLHGTALFPVACYYDDLTTESLPWHWHDELEALIVVESGRGKAFSAIPGCCTRRGMPGTPVVCCIRWCFIPGWSAAASTASSGRTIFSLCWKIYPARVSCLTALRSGIETGSSLLKTHGSFVWRNRPDTSSQSVPHCLNWFFCSPATARQCPSLLPSGPCGRPSESRLCFSLYRNIIPKSWTQHKSQPAPG